MLIEANPHAPKKIDVLKTSLPTDPHTELQALLIQPAKRIEDLIQALAFGGEKGLMSPEISLLPVFRTTETSGYNFSSHHKMLAYVRFGVTTSHYFVVQSLMLTPGASWVSHYYTADGKYAFTEGPISHQFAQHPVSLMEPSCPILNHIYNILTAHYAEARSGKINTQLTRTLERVVQKLYRSQSRSFSVALRANDPAIQTIRKQIDQVERDEVLNWKERYHLIRELRNSRRDLIATKARAHRFWRFKWIPGLFLQDSADLVRRFKVRPLNNLIGILDRILIDPIRWFGGVVRNNMGYSIALAIYSPFTFFFITQPMNPHAMWAVGNVRSAYLDTTAKVKGWLEGVVTFGTAQKALSTSPAAAQASATSPTKTALQNAGPLAAVLGGMEVTANQSRLNAQGWDQRMSDFKALQIQYEENLEIAPRMGRLEQMETQLNWPLIIESAWLETERYLNFLSFIQSNAKDYAAAYLQFVKAERARTEQVQLYLWDKNVRFILDHPYTLMNESKEQTQFDHYIGRSFILLREMTQNLMARYQNLPLPQGFEKIESLATQFEKDYRQNPSVLERLKANSKLFGQKDSTNTDELRQYMKRQWELLYLLQNRAQEASNNGLQLYVWSVRNTAYLLQSLYSSKREEMSVLALQFKRGTNVNKSTNAKFGETLAFKKVDSQFEALFHMMVLEFASLQKEFNSALPNDLETTQRKKIIQGVESFLKERDVLLKGANLL